MSGLAADPTRDAAYRAHARGLAKHLRDRVADITTSSAAMDSIAHRGYAAGNIHVTRGEPDVDPVDLGLPPTIRFTLLLQTHRDPVAGFGVGRDGQENLMFLNFLPRDAKQAARSRQGRFALQRYLNDVFAQHENILIHELIHMLDHLRGNVTLEKEPIYSRATGAAQSVLYYNSPEEFNAFFQQIVSIVEDTLQTSTPPGKALLLRSFERFSQMVERIPYIQRMRPHLTKDYARKLDARLYQTWEYLREKHAR